MDKYSLKGSVHLWGFMHHDLRWWSHWTLSTIWTFHSILNHNQMRRKDISFIETIGCHTSHVETLLHNVCTNLSRSQRQSPIPCLSTLAKCATLCSTPLRGLDNELTLLSSIDTLHSLIKCLITLMCIEVILRFDSFNFEIVLLFSQWSSISFWQERITSISVTNLLIEKAYTTASIEDWATKIYLVLFQHTAHSYNMNAYSDYDFVSSHLVIWYLASLWPFIV